MGPRCAERGADEINVVGNGLVGEIAPDLAGRMSFEVVSEEVWLFDGNRRMLGSSDWYMWLLTVVL